MKIRNQAYLPHVDGLRCLAVVSVLLFHFGVPGLGGGYVGVDVFFVISGYLITKIIIDEVVATGSFNFRHFYARRIRRILPALIATAAVTTLVAVASLTPAYLVAYGKSLAASAASVSNLLFWSESGYFDAASKTKPLLHTWSLSVEEQFYLFWPALIYLSHRFLGKKGLIWSIYVVGVLSFIANYLAVTAHSIGFKSDLFFLPQFRVFEFAIGAIGCITTKKLPPSRWLHELMMALGLTMIVYSIVWLREGMVFPYVKAIPSCLGSLLVISAHGSKSVGRLLTNKAAIWGGTISYSLYLTHWPIVVFVEQYLPAATWGIKVVMLAPLSLVTAIALHYLIEVRFRYAGLNTSQRSVVSRIAATSATLCVMGVAVYLSNGMMWRYKYFTPGSLEWTPYTECGEIEGGHRGWWERRRVGCVHAGHAWRSDKQAEPVFRPLSSADIETGEGQRFAGLAAACNVEVLGDSTRCFMNRPEQVLFFGNSHEPDAFNAFNHIYGKDQRVNLINFGTVNDCGMVLGSDSVSSPRRELACDGRFRTLNDDAFLKKVDIVVYNTHQGFDFVARDLWGVLELLKRKNPSIKIMAIGSYLQTTIDCSSLYNKYKTYDACKRKEFVNYFAPDEQSRSPLPQVKSLNYLYISKYDLFCTKRELSTCVMYANGEPAFYDQDHLSLGFAKYMGDRIVELHRDDLAKIGLPVPAGWISSRGPLAAPDPHAPGVQH
jgi:peptidoglycan/LPS O-acetylase OafA/YrhL